MGHGFQPAMHKPSLEKIGPVEYLLSALLKDSKEGGLSFTKIIEYFYQNLPRKYFHYQSRHEGKKFTPSPLSGLSAKERFVWTWVSIR